MKRITVPASVAAALVFGASAVLGAEAKDNWAHNCASCHGPDGAGHTKAGRMSQVKNMTDPKYQASFSDEQAAKQVKEGLKDPSGKEKMRAFGDTLSDADIKALVDYVRAFQPK